MWTRYILDCDLDRLVAEGNLSPQTLTSFVAHLALIVTDSDAVQATGAVRATTSDLSWAKLFLGALKAMRPETIALSWLRVPPQLLDQLLTTAPGCITLLSEPLPVCELERTALASSCRRLAKASVVLALDVGGCLLSSDERERLKEEFAAWQIFPLPDADPLEEITAHIDERGFGWRIAEGKEIVTSKPLVDLAPEDARAELFGDVADKAVNIPFPMAVPLADGSSRVEYWSGGTMATGDHYNQLQAQAALGFLDGCEFATWQRQLALDLGLKDVGQWFEFHFTSILWHSVGLAEQEGERLVMPKGDAHEVVVLAGCMTEGPRRTATILHSLGLVAWDGTRIMDTPVWGAVPIGKQLRFANELAETVAKAVVVVARSKAPEPGRRKSVEALRHLGSPRAFNAVRWLERYEPEYAAALKKRLNAGAAKTREDQARKDPIKAIVCVEKTVQIICEAFRGRWA